MPFMSLRILPVVHHVFAFLLFLSLPPCGAILFACFTALRRPGYCTPCPDFDSGVCVSMHGSVPGLRLSHAIWLFRPGSSASARSFSNQASCLTLPKLRDSSFFQMYAVILRLSQFIRFTLNISPRGCLSLILIWASPSSISSA